MASRERARSIATCVAAAAGTDVRSEYTYNTKSRIEACTGAGTGLQYSADLWACGQGQQAAAQMNLSPTVAYRVKGTILAVEGPYCDIADLYEKDVRHN